MSGDGWSENSQYILRELERLNGNIEHALSELHRIHTEIELLKYKHTLWGAIGGMIPVGVYAFWELFNRR